MQRRSALVHQASLEELAHALLLYSHRSSYLPRASSKRRRGESLCARADLEQRWGHTLGVSNFCERLVAELNWSTRCSVCAADHFPERIRNVNYFALHSCLVGIWYRFSHPPAPRRRGGEFQVVWDALCGSSPCLSGIFILAPVVLAILWVATMFDTSIQFFGYAIEIKTRYFYFILHLSAHANKYIPFIKTI